MTRPTWPLARFMRVLFLALVVLGCFAQPARAAANKAAKSEKIVTGPRAPWVDLAPDSRGGAGAPPGSALGDVYDEISDEQIHVRPVAERGLGARMFTTAHYTRNRRHIVTSSGVERASELRFEVDPSYERVVIHSIRVIRPSATWCGRGGSGCASGCACSCPPRAKSRADAERDLLGRKCACGPKLTGPFPDSAWSTIAPGEKSVTVGRAECGCGVTTRRYFVVEGVPPGQV